MVVENIKLFESVRNSNICGLQKKNMSQITKQTVILYSHKLICYQE